MDQKEFGSKISALMRKQNLTREECYEMFLDVLRNDQTDLQQGAFLAGLNAKGETAEEIAGAWEAIYHQDTVKVSIDDDCPIIDNCGTGMDTFKTFNISTAASLIASSEGAMIARHGSRALTSVCGTVDLAEALGVNVECTAEKVKQSIKSCGLGLFNGMSSEIHPGALGRILSQINFGTTLNIAASLANPAMPDHGVRGVYSKDMVMPVVDVMKEIGYCRAVVFYGSIDGNGLGMDEASVCGPTLGAELFQDGSIAEFNLEPADLGIPIHNPELLKPLGTPEMEAARITELLQGEGETAVKDAVSLNAGLILYVSGIVSSIRDAFYCAKESLEKGKGWDQLNSWVSAQS